MFSPLSTQAQKAKSQASPSKSFPVFHFQTYSFLRRKRKGTKDSASAAQSSSKKAVILMENLLALINFKLFSNSPLKPLLSFLVVNFIVLSFGLIFAFFSFELQRQHFREK